MMIFFFKLGFCREERVHPTADLEMSEDLLPNETNVGWLQRRCFGENCFFFFFLSHPWRSYLYPNVGYSHVKMVDFFFVNREVFLD